MKMPFFSSSFSSLTTGRVLAILRDGKHLVGTLRSFDQFSNVVLDGTVERRNVGKKCVDVPVGLFVLRADNVVMLGLVDEKRERGELEFVDRSVLSELWNSEEQASERDRVWNFDKW